MSNEEFNALNVTDLHDTLQADIRAMIPSMNESFHRMESFQIEIIQSMLNTILKSLNAFGSYVQGQFSGQNQPLGTDPDAFDFSAGSTITTPTQEQLDFFSSQSAGGEDSTFTPTPELESNNLNAIEKWASKWIKKQGSGWTVNFKSATLKEIRYLIDQRVKGNLYPQIKSLGKSLLKAEKEKKPKFNPEEIKSKIDATSTGITQKIATLFNNVRTQLEIWKKSPKSVQKFNKLLVAMKTYNQFVAKNGRPNLMIDTAKSVNAKPPRIIKK